MLPSFEELVHGQVLEIEKLSRKRSGNDLEDLVFSGRKSQVLPVFWDRLTNDCRFKGFGKGWRGNRIFFYNWWTVSKLSIFHYFSSSDILYQLSGLGNFLLVSLIDSSWGFLLSLALKSFLELALLLLCWMMSAFHICNLFLACVEQKDCFGILFSGFENFWILVKISSDFENSKISSP